ncbi:MAG: hypothetical protein ACXVEJ_08410 [Nocardioides sp.]
MRTDWVPVSAAALLTGAMALTFGSLIMPSTGGSTSDTLSIVQQEGGRWMAVAVIYFLASVALTLGMPAALTLFDRRGQRLSMVAAVVLAVGFLGTAGYAMLMVFFRSLVVTHAIVGKSIEDVAHETGLAIFLYGWIVAFFLGELLLAVALLRARTTPVWVPSVLLAHVASVFVSSLVPNVVSKAFVLLLALGFAGMAIEAVARDNASRRTLL